MAFGRPRRSVALRPGRSAVAARRRAPLRAPPGSRAGRGDCRCTHADLGRRRHVTSSSAERCRTVGVGEGRRVAIGRRQRHDHEVAPADRAPAELGVGRRVAIDPRRRRLQPQRLLDGGRGQDRSSRSMASWSGWVSRCQKSVVVMPSLVSMPPNIITAAFETTSAGVSVAVASASRPIAVARSCRRRGGPAPPPRREPAGRPRRRPRSDRPRRRSRRTSQGRRQARRRAGRARRRRRLRPAARRARAGFRRCPPGPASATSRPASSATARGEAVLHLGPRRTPGKRVAMALVLVAIERQHARADDLGRREAGIVDGEARGVAHHLDAQVATGHEPAVEDRHP